MDRFFCLTNTSPRALQPSAISVPLLKSQLASLHACQEFESKRCFDRVVSGTNIKVRSNISILADITGYGKSLVTLGLIATKPAPATGQSTKTVDANCCGQLVIEKERVEEYVPTTILVAPNKLIPQWIKEANKTSIRYSIVPPSGDDVDFSADVIFCRSSRYNHFMQNISQGLFFYRTIFDEADSISISSMEEPRSELILLVTATPEAIPYIRNCGWLKNTFAKKNSCGATYYDHSIFQLLSIRCDPAFARRCHPIPPIRKTIVPCWTPAHIRIIKDFVPATVRSMLNGGDLIGAVRAMGGGEHSTLNIIDIIKNRFILKIQEREAAITDVNLATSYTDGEKQARIARYVIDIKRLRNDQTEFLQRIDSVDQQTCPICYDNINNLCMTPCCNGFFCQSCISDWFKTNTICPMCRSYVHMSKLIVHNADCKSPTIKSVKSKPVLASKEDTVVKILLDNNTGSFLIFSDHDRTSDILYNKITEKGISYQKLGGHAGTVKKALDDSESRNTRALFMNARKDGAGLNMPWINNIIIYHKLSDSVLTQVLGRTSRIGQKKSVKVWFLEYEGEYSDPPNTTLFEDTP